MNELVDGQFLENFVAAARDWASRELLTTAALWEAGVIAAAFALALLITPPIRRWLGQREAATADDPRLAFICDTFENLVTPVMWVILLWLAVDVADRMQGHSKLISIFVSLVNAWIAVHLVTKFVSDRFWARLAAVLIWIVAVLNIAELLEPALSVLDGIALQIGGFRVTALSAAKGVVYLVILLWLASVVSSILERRVRRVPGLTPSVQVLFAKLVKITLVVAAVVVAVNAVGVDLTAFAVFGGALGVGIGFGLQKIVANFISGIILLLDKSIKPGDTIGVAGTYGWIQSLGARYVSVITRDGIEHLIPNEELITTRVENWSYSNNLVRQRIPVGISYGSDIRRAMALCVEAAKENRRVVETPSPICLLRGFGDSSIDLEIRCWMVDPQNGVSNLKSEILLGVWDRFRANNIEIPFPQRDLHVKSVSPAARAAVIGEALGPTDQAT